MDKYERFLDDLKQFGTAKMKVFGQSMKPKIQSGSTLTYQKADVYEIGDIVCCRVKGRYLTHLITQKDESGRYMIANNNGHQNGWTRRILAKVIAIEPPT